MSGERTCARLLAGCAAALLLLAANARAQDEAIPASQEPRHVVKLENDLVRVIEVEIPQGEQTRYHTHALDYPYVLLSDVTLSNQIPGQEASDAPMHAGFVGYYDASAKGAYTHRFINRGPGAFHAIGIELLKPAQRDAPASASLPPLEGAETVLDNARIGAYRIKLAPGASVGPLTIAGPSVRVAVSAGKLLHEVEEAQSQMRLTPGQFVFQPQTTTATFTNAGSSALELVEIVLK
jgi:quercetin dioxygenase-like cupin family protein